MRKHFTYILILFFFVLASCKEANNEGNTETVLHETNMEPDYFIDEFIEDVEESPELQLESYNSGIYLAEKVFDMNSMINTESCIIYNDGCDCCEGKIIFIDDNIFMEEFFCIPYNNYYIGYYNIIDQKVKLYYETLYISYGPEEGFDYDSENVYQANHLKETITITLQSINCNDKLILKSDDDFYIESHSSFESIYKTYSESEVWKLLNVNETIENYYQ